MQISFDKYPKTWFICVGAAKCGTTSLHYYLKQHNEIALPSPKKETRFFSTPDKTDKDVDYYLENYFNPPKMNEKKMKYGEICPEYMVVSSAHQRILKLLGTINIIFIVRDPIARAYSHFRFQKSRRKEFRSFEEAIKGELKELKNIADNAWIEDWDTHYISCGLYFRQIKPYIETFGFENVMCISYNEYSNNCEQVLLAICNFIGVEPSFSFNTTPKHNITESIHNLRFDNFLYEDSNLKQVIKKIFPERYRIKIKPWLRQMNRTKKKMYPAPKHVLETLANIYRDENKELKDLYPFIKDF